MENNKEIGKLFKEKLNSLEAIPKDSGWNEIQKELDKKKKKKFFLFPFWIGAICLLSILLIIQYSKFSTGKTITLDMSKKPDSSSIATKSDINTLEKLNSIRTIKTNENDINLKKLTSIKSKNKTQKIFEKINSQKRLVTKNQSKTNNKNYSSNNKILSANENTFAENEKTSDLNLENFDNKKSNLDSVLDKIDGSNLSIKINIAEDLTNNSNSISSKNKRELILEKRNLDKILGNKKKDSIAIEKAKNKIVKSEEKESTKTKKEGKQTFEIFIYGAPNIVIQNSKSAIDTRLDANKKTAQVTFNFGGYMSFQSTEKLSFRVGVEKTSMKLITVDAEINTSNYSNINYATGFSNSFIYSQSKNAQKMNLIQEISYTEIPLEVKYTIINKKIGLNGIGGISYLFLNNNIIYAETNNGINYEIGKTSRVFDRTFGINLGLGVDYKITKRIKFNIEPMLKYNLKPSDNDITNPISISVLSGFQIIINEQ